MGQYLKAATLQDLPTDSVKIVQLAGHSIALFNVDDVIHALDGSCQGCGTVISDAIVTEDGVCCPHHGWTLDVDEGFCPVCPDERIRTYPVRVDGDTILVEVE